MGLSSLPAPSEGVLSVVLVNTALSITLFKEIFRSILHVVGIHLHPPSDLDDDDAPSSSSSSDPPFGFPPFADEFRCWVPSSRYNSFCSGPAAEEEECSVCLTRFEPESEVNRLGCCGHFFHKGCLERWLDYWHVTCPMCRAPLVHEEDGEEGEAWF